MAKTTTALADGDLQFGADETRDAAPDDKTALPARGEGGRRLGHDPFPAARILRWQDGRRRRNQRAGYALEGADAEARQEAPAHRTRPEMKNPPLARRGSSR
jgi:hypothetical protein